jgi:hypothetical protein
MLVIYDMTGRKALQSTLDGTNPITISTSGLAPGLYTVVVSDSDNILTKQRIVIRK